MQDERRSGPRYPFIAMAEIVDDHESARTSTRINNLSHHGCYVETKAPFPPGTSVTIEIYTETESLETPARVAYLEPKAGMGLIFDKMPEYFTNTLKKWLREAKRRRVGSGASRSK